MVPEQCLFVLRLVGYCLLSVISFICWIPLSIVLDKHWGYCLLYADSVEYGHVAPCGYTITVPIIFSLFYAGYMTGSYFCKLAFYNRQGYIEETAVEFLITVVMDGLSWIFMFVNASLISAGFNSMCWNIFGTSEKCANGVLRHPIFGTDVRFFHHLQTAEVAAWLSWLLWLFQFLMGLMALGRSGMFDTCVNNSTNGFCGSLPYKPHCICSCKLQIQRHQAPESTPVPVKKI